jgi:TolA-binding protein
MQRDYYDLQRKVDELKASQTTKAGELETLIKQLTEGNTKISAEIRSLQDKIAASQADQAKVVTAPISDLERAFKELSNLVTGLQTSQITSAKRLDTTATKEELDRALRLILGQLDTLKAPEPVTVGPTPEQAAQLAFAAAQAQRVTNKPELALPAFVDLANTYPTSPYAPMAWFEVGSLYAASAERSEDAIDAFDRVLERFGENPVKGPAHLRKAEVLEKLGEKEAAAREYDVYATENPGEMAIAARARAQELRKPPPAPPKNTPKGKNPKKSSK